MKEKLQKIKLLILDVDGVMTDGKIIYDSDGREMKIFDVQDGMGIAIGRLAGLKYGIISGRVSEVVLKRATELKIEDIFQGRISKTEPYQKIRKKYGLEDKEIAFIGDDLIDLPIIRRCGFGVAVPNAIPEVKEAADYTTTARGGKGAIRETIELILKTQRKWDETVEKVINI